jgi:hypothetical protein
MYWYSCTSSEPLEILPDPSPFIPKQLCGLCIDSPVLGLPELVAEPGVADVFNFLIISGLL